VSDASITPLEYLIPRMDVPVTIGRRVRSVALSEVDEARGAPPAERLSDMMVWIMNMNRRKEEEEEELKDGIFEISF